MIYFDFYYSRILLLIKNYDDIQYESYYYNNIVNVLNRTKNISLINIFDRNRRLG